MDEVIKVENTGNMEVFKSLVKTASFKRLQLFGASNEIVKEGKFPMGHFGIVDGSEIVDIGERFNCLVIDWRPKAMRIGDPITILYDFENAEFKKIVEESEVKDSGCMYGIEFLLFIPNHGFIPYFLCSASTRYEAGAFRANLGKVIELKSIFVKSAKFSWHAPKVIASNIPLEKMPSQEEIEAELKDFRNPESVIAERATEDERTR